MIAEGDITHYIGDSVALAVSKKRESLPKFGTHRVDYTPFEPIVDPFEAMKEDARRSTPKGTFSPLNICAAEIRRRP